MAWARGIQRVFETFCESDFLRGDLPTVLGGVWLGRGRGVGVDFGGGDWALGYVCAQIWDFPNISLFPRILSLKLFGNSYTKFALVDITFRFTCGSSGLY